MEAEGIKGLKVQQIGETETHQFLIKAQGDEKSLNLVSRHVSDALTKSLKVGEFEIQRADMVGPAAGSSLRNSGFLSMLYALLYLTGYNLPLDQIKQFRQWKSMTPGHPEYGLGSGGRSYHRPARPGVCQWSGDGYRRKMASAAFQQTRT
jgi:hypothetical protein